ncbi:hypothetical protein B0A69_17565 [Chryseobacterium shigense]|uniref:Uncharacterized protein n=1 Tax=Chryseobacterium shigense TaxID=297244 RepID=A0A1N7ID27_9FLAO|nr:hypothetical protein [Chryseobacterium shigense]PQA91609.1 hypothetical protein B0A69_17565 [Chryseobacterium shigense]SIS34983.1 hypothetical protein SAMN05421639_103132 [Chryseobacterium shigense]
MIDQIIKKNIRLLSERYHHDVLYYERVIAIKNEKNVIEIFSQIKDHISITYNFEEGIEKVEIRNIEIYDLLIKIFLRKNLEKVNLSPGYPLNLKDIEEEFGNLHRFEEELMTLINTETHYSHIGGNRVLAELYKNILILRDDIGSSKANVLNISNDKI